MYYEIIFGDIKEIPDFIHINFKIGNLKRFMVIGVNSTGIQR